MLDRSYSQYPKKMAFTELGSPRQVQRISKDIGNSWKKLDENERTQLKRCQFAFGTIYPYTFDGLDYIATHHKELSEEYGRELIKDSDEYYYVLELPITDFFHYCLLDWAGTSKEYLRSELLRHNDREKLFRYIPYGKGDYVSLQPIMIGFHYKKPSEISKEEVQKMKNLKTFNEETKIAKTIIIYVLKPLISPILEEDYEEGVFSIPSALQAKIDYTLQERQKNKKNFSDGLKSLFLRKYFLYLNCNDGSQNTNYMLVDAIKLWEHVSPSEINVNGSYKNLRDWNKARIKLENANKFFSTMEEQGLMKGAKAHPAINTKGTYPKGIFYHQEIKKYQIYFKRSPEVPFKKA